VQLQWDREVRLCERNNSADPEVSLEGGGGGAPGAGAEVPLQPAEQTMVRQAVPCSPGRSPPAPQGGPHTGAGGSPKESDPVESPC